MRAAIDFKNEPVGKLLLRLGVPSFLAIVMNLLYGFIDGAFIGNGINSNALGGVTIVFPLTIIIVSFASLIGEGLSSIVARAIAAGKKEDVMEAIRTGHGLTFWISVFLIIATSLNLKSIIELLGATAEIAPYARDYLKALLIGLPFMGLSLVYFHQLNAHGEMRVAMKAMALSTILNVILDYIAIYMLEWGVIGAGVATSLSQIVWFGYMHINAIRNPNIYTVLWPVNLKISLTKTKEILAIGFGAFVRQFGISIALILINTLASQYGSSIHITAFGATQRVFRLMIAPIAAISTALKPMIGQNYGYKEYERVKDSIWYGFKTSLLFGIILLGVIVVFRENFGAMFGISGEDMKVFVRVLLLTSCLFPLYGIQHITVSYFMSIGKSKQAIILNLLKQVIFLIPLVFILPRLLGVYGLFLAIPMADLMTIGVSLIMLRNDTRILGL